MENDIADNEKPYTETPNTIYYDKIYDDGHLGSNTESAENAYRLGWINNKINKNDVKRSDVNGYLYLIDKCPEKTISEHITDKLREISWAFSKFDNYVAKDLYVYSSLGFQVNADRRSLDNVRNLIENNSDCEFKDYNNKIHNITTIELNTLYKEIRSNLLNLTAQKTKMQSDVNKMRSIDRIDNYQITIEMMDFRT